jgi:glyoxylase-like metal-dependent hydrolase (beta-lactamase superfamily II)
VVLGLLIVLLAACRPPEALAEATEAPTTVALSELAPGVWLHTSTRDLDGVGPFPSHGLVVEGPDGLLLVDSAWGEAATADLLAQIRAKWGRAPAAAVFTHAHDDRAGGAGTLHAAGVETWATPGTASRMVADGRPAPSRALDVPLDAEALAGVSVEVFFPGPAHTPDNVVVWLPDSGVLFGGCMIRPAGSGSLGNLADADLAAWPASAAAVEQRYGAARIVVPSHGAPGDAALLAHTRQLATASRP